MISMVLNIISSITSGVLLFLLTNQIKENRTIRDSRKQENMAKENSISNGIVCLLIMSPLEVSRVMQGAIGN